MSDSTQPKIEPNTSSLSAGALADMKRDLIRDIKASYLGLAEPVKDGIHGGILMRAPFDKILADLDKWVGALKSYNDAVRQSDATQPTGAADFHDVEKYTRDLAWDLDEVLKHLDEIVVRADSAAAHAHERSAGVADLFSEGSSLKELRDQFDSIRSSVEAVTAKLRLITTASDASGMSADEYTAKNEEAAAIVKDGFAAYEARIRGVIDSTKYLGGLIGRISREM